MKLVYINKDYIYYLRKISNNVRTKEKRPYAGVVLKVNNKDYYAPLSTHRPKFDKFPHNMKEIVKLGKGYTNNTNPSDVKNKLGILNINNMIPVDSSLIIEFDISRIPNINEKIMTQNQYKFIRANKELITQKADFLYNLKTNTDITLDHVVDYKLMEEKMIEYIQENKIKKENTEIEEEIEEDIER